MADSDAAARDAVGVRLFRRVAFLEGTSFLLLLGVAMPLKYFAGIPLAVRIVGLAHGVLFVVYALLVARPFVRRTWTFQRSVEAMMWGFVPFGTYLFDAKLEREEAGFAGVTRPH